MLIISQDFPRYIASGPASFLNSVIPCASDFNLHKFIGETDQIILLCNISAKDMEFENGYYLGVGEFTMIHGKAESVAPRDDPILNELRWRSLKVRDPSLQQPGLLYTISHDFFNEMAGFLSIDLDFSDLFEFQAVLMDSDILDLVMGTWTHIAILNAPRSPSTASLDSWFDELDDYVMELFHSLLRYLKMKQKALDERISKKEQTRKDLIQALLRGKGFLELNFREKLDNRLISENAGISLYHFQRLFKQIFDLTPGQYLTRYRLNEARKLILYEKESITRVSLEVGYESLSSFIHAYEAQFGHSPSNTRESE